MKKRRWKIWCTALACALCIFGAGKATAVSNAETATAAAEQSQEYVWDSVESIAIAPPFTYSSYETASFQVFFNKDITHVNYKHLAAGATALKTFSKRDTPNMTPAIIDSLDESGVLDSMNDCIAFNGKTVREWQQFGFLACMIQVGELGVNNSMNIDFNGGIPGSRIEDFNQPFTFTFYEGLKFPSGVELKETVSWVYDPASKTFSKITESEPNETGFTAYYNGQKITKDNNLVTIFDKDTFSFDNLTIQANSVDATVVIEPQFETLEAGYNYVLVTVKAENEVDFEHLQIVFDLQQTEPVVAATGCASALSSIGSFAILAACGLVLTKRSKRA